MARPVQCLGVMAKTNIRNLSGEIALYGARSCGFDYLATSAAGFTAGSQRGETMRYESITECVWRAVADLRDAGLAGDAEIMIHDIGGERAARVHLDSVPSYGAIVWNAGLVTYTVSL